MWVMVFFDLPTETKKDRRIASKFRKALLVDGFAMFQFSIYTRFCPSKENVAVHIKRVKSQLPPQGKICIINITDRQFGLMELFNGTKPQKNQRPSQQLELF